MFEEIYNVALALKLRHDRPMASHLTADPPRIKPTSCTFAETIIVGREVDKDKVKKMLLADVDDGAGRSYDHKKNVRVVSIVGVGGVGKTTLAQQVYNDDQVRDGFETRLWICATGGLDATRLMKDILDQLEAMQGRPGEFPGFSTSPEESLNADELIKKAKRFLLVLDDVWDDIFQGYPAGKLMWRSLLSSGAEGSRVLITTRNEDVSRILGASAEANTYKLGLLSDEESWLLFEKHAFSRCDSGDHPNLVAIGKQIVKQCGGVPLAVKTLAGLLSRQFREGRWEMKEGNDDILPILNLSYQRLPPPVKPCFAYCAGFPVDHTFDGDELLSLWMAQGYVKPVAGGKSMEEVGREYLRDLLGRSFFESLDHDDSDTDGHYLASSSTAGGQGRSSQTPFVQQRYAGRFFLMHDLIHDLALHVSGGECSKFEGGNLSNGTRKVRHLWLPGQMLADFTKLLLQRCSDESFLQYLRTFYVVGSHQSSHSAIPRGVLDGMLQSMRRLRVLDLGAAAISELPDSIGGMKHLRYLHISGGQLRGLPESLGSLLYLQTLIVKGARHMEKLPMCLVKLINLRYLVLHKF